MSGEGPFVWLDGALVAGDTATVSPYDRGLVVGDGVFETLKVVDGTAFALSRHLRRLARSAAGLGLAVPDEVEVRRGVAEILAANGPDVGRLRITVTGGSGPLGSARDADGGTGSMVMLLTGPRKVWNPTAVVVVCPWVRNERSAVAGLKTTSYAENARALAFAHERGADEALFANTRDHLCEGTGTNVFVVVDGELRTPPLHSGCLAGITRELIVELGLATEVDLPIEALAEASEVFLTSSTRDVQPVASLDGRALQPCPGPITAEAASRFAALEATNPDP